ncbi:MAG: hypothetical protein JWM11_160 [Planctomycetaceae bacterium]|nr:hypothetical protein [Planctomycetaceae bacterium]
MRRFIAGISIENDSFVAANSTKLQSFPIVPDSALTSKPIRGFEFSGGGISVKGVDTNAPVPGWLSPRPLELLFQAIPL